MEEETFRYQIYNSMYMFGIYKPSKILSENEIRSAVDLTNFLNIPNGHYYVKNVILYLVILSLIILLFSIAILSANYNKNNFNYNKAFIIFILLVLSVVLYLNIKYKAPDFTNNEYAKEYSKVLTEFKSILNKSYKYSGTSTEEYFIEKGFQDHGEQRGYKISEEFIDAFMTRWKSKYRNEEKVDKYTEVLYTNIDNLKDIESILFNMNASGKITGMTENGAEILLRMCRPEKSIFRQKNNIIRVRDLELLYKSYIDWACLHKDKFELKEDCNYLRLRMKHLPELSDFDTYDIISKQIYLFKIYAWIVLIIIAYIMFHSVYENEAFIQKFILIFILFIIIVFLYYMMVVRLGV
jgi:hypothetical protein